MSNDYRHLAWQCRRGLKELDVFFDPFYKEHFNQLTDAQKQTFARLMTCEDIDLFDWIMGNAIPEDEELKAILDVIKAKVKPNH